MLTVTPHSINNEIDTQYENRRSLLAIFGVTKMLRILRLNFNNSIYLFIYFFDLCEYVIFIDNLRKVFVFENETSTAGAKMREREMVSGRTLSCHRRPLQIKYS